MGGFTTDAAQLQAGDARLAEAARHGRAAVVELAERAAVLLGHGWQGDAAGAFRQGWHDWLAGVHDLLSALDEMAVALGRSGAGYVDVEGAVRVSLVKAAG